MMMMTTTKDTGTTEASPPMDAAQVMERVEHLTGLVRGIVKDVPEDEAGVQRQLTSRLQELELLVPVSWATKLRSEVNHSEQLLTDLEAAIVEAEAVRAGTATRLVGLEAELLATAAGAPPPSPLGLQRLEIAEKAAQVADGEIERLDTVLVAAKRIIPAATGCVALLVLAEASAMRRYQVQQAQTWLAGLRRQAQDFREATKKAIHEGDARLEHWAGKVGRPLPVPDIRWPRDPLGDPEIVEPASESKRR